MHGLAVHPRGRWRCGRFWGLSVALLCFSRLAAAEGTTNTASAISFLRLQLNGNGVALKEAVTVPGTLKPSRAPQPDHGLRVVVEAADGATLWEGRSADPCERRWEMPEPEDPSNWTVKWEVVAEAEFTVRIPARTGGRRLALYRFQPAETSTANSSASPAGPTSKLLGRIDLPIPSDVP